MSSQASNYAQNNASDDGTGKLIPSSQRPDGSWRKARRMKEGYVPQEEVPLYQSKGKQFRETRESALPPGLTPSMLEKMKPKKEEKEKTQSSTSTSNKSSSSKKSKTNNKNSSKKIDYFEENSGASSPENNNGSSFEMLPPLGVSLGLEQTGIAASSGEWQIVGGKKSKNKKANASGKKGGLAPEDLVQTTALNSKFSSLKVEEEVETGKVLTSFNNKKNKENEKNKPGKDKKKPTDGKPKEEKKKNDKDISNKQPSNISKIGEKKPTSTANTRLSSDPVLIDLSAIPDPAKRLRNLRKKLKDIELLKAQVKSKKDAKVLEKDQLEKMAREGEILAQIEQLRQLVELN